MITVKVVSDVICPWCYIGKRRLEAALGELPEGTKVSVSWHPFQLNPDMPSNGMDRMEYCTRKFGSWDRCEEMFVQIASVGKTVGINFRFDRQQIVPNTRLAHRAIWYAGREGVQDAVAEALFRAYFCDGADLSGVPPLTKICATAGLEGAKLEAFLKSEEGILDVQAEEHEIKSLGISAVPLFIVDDCVAISGAQPPHALLEAFEQARKVKRKQRSPAVV